MVEAARKENGRATYKDLEAVPEPKKAEEVVAKERSDEKKA
jgi:hypothetical protein